MKLILLGPPGSGKGTQAEAICLHLGIPAISTGNIIREAMKNGTAAGLQAKSYVEAGRLVPDEIVIALLQERLAWDDCKNGFILDGFPRTLPQAEALDYMGVVIDKVIDLAVPDAEIKKRLTGRRVCGACGASYHVAHKPPEREGLCDQCGAALLIRNDDEPETVRRRLTVYHEQTVPLKDYYLAAGKLVAVEGGGDVSTTTGMILALLGV